MRSNLQQKHRRYLFYNYFKLLVSAKELGEKILYAWKLTYLQLVVCVKYPKVHFAEGIIFFGKQ